MHIIVGGNTGEESEGRRMYKERNDSLDDEHIIF